MAAPRCSGARTTPPDAWETSSSRNAAYDAGANDIVGKPIEPSVLITIVGAALRTRAALNG